jgi:hypothetical protein
MDKKDSLFGDGETLSFRVFYLLILQGHSLLQIALFLLGDRHRGIWGPVILAGLIGGALIWFAWVYLSRSGKQGLWAIAGAFNFPGWVVLWAAFSEKLHPPRRGFKVLRPSDREWDADRAAIDQWVDQRRNRSRDTAGSAISPPPQGADDVP